MGHISSSENLQWILWSRRSYKKALKKQKMKSSLKASTATTWCLRANTVTIWRQVRWIWKVRAPTIRSRRYLMTTRAVIRAIHKMTMRVMMTTASRIATIVRLPMCTTMRSSSPKKQKKNLPKTPLAIKLRSLKVRRSPASRPLRASPR